MIPIIKDYFFYISRYSKFTVKSTFITSDNNHKEQSTKKNISSSTLYLNICLISYKILYGFKLFLRRKQMEDYNTFKLINQKWVFWINYKRLVWNGNLLFCLRYSGFLIIYSWCGSILKVDCHQIILANWLFETLVLLNLQVLE